MKKSAIVLLFAAVLAACVNEVEIKNRNVGSYLILNAMIDAEEPLHEVHLSYYNGSDAVLPEGAEVTMSVNGVRRGATGCEGSGVSNVYSFSVSLKPGDIVRIDARYGGQEVYAEVEVPQRAELVSADTLRREYTEKPDFYFGSDRRIDFSLRLRDIAGERNWYRITMERDYKFAAHFIEDAEKDIYPRADSIYHQVQRVKFDIGTDKILLDDYLPETTNYKDLSDLFGQLNPRNTMRVFSDERFADSVGDVKFSVDSLDFVAYYQGIRYQKLDLPDGTYGYYASYDADVYPLARLRLHSLSFDAYNYFRAINSCSLFGYEMTLLTEPTSIPSNVVGGLGFVSATSGSDVLIEFPSYVVSTPRE